MIRPVIKTDAGRLTKIYNRYIINSTATFEIDPIRSNEMVKRLEKVNKNHPWLVYEMDGVVVGYAYAGEWKPRPAYKFTVEVSVYIDPNHHGKGVGFMLYQKLIDQLKQTEIRALLAGITLPNDPSIKLHQKLGFVNVGQLKSVGFKFGNWIDVGYWELLL